MDAIKLLKDDHKTVKDLFRKFEKAGDGARAEKRRLVDRIVEELSIHAVIEEQLFYPVARATVPGTDDLTLESLEEHGVVKWLLADLDKMDPTEERFDAKVTVMIENVRHHIEEEEGEFFPKVRDELGRKALNDLGDAMVEAKKTAPTHPHPRAPDEPPANAVVGNIAGVTDRLGDTVSGVAQGSIAAAQDLIATILGRKKPSSVPRGSKVSRDAARGVRGRASSITEETIDAVQQAKKTGKATVKGARKGAKTAGAGTAQTARSARSGVKGTVTTAKRSAASTRATAKRATTTTAKTAKSAAKKTRSSAKRSTAASKRS